MNEVERFKKIKKSASILTKISIAWSFLTIVLFAFYGYKLYIKGQTLGAWIIFIICAIFFATQIILLTSNEDKKEKKKKRKSVKKLFAFLSKIIKLTVLVLSIVTLIQGGSDVKLLDIIMVIWMVLSILLTIQLFVVKLIFKKLLSIVTKKKKASPDDERLLENL